MTRLICRLLGHRPITFADPFTWAPVDLCTRCWGSL